MILALCLTVGALRPGRVEADERTAARAGHPAHAAAGTPEPGRDDPETEASRETPASFVNGLGMRFSRIPPGNFTMGSPVTEPGRDRDEAPHRVIIHRGFFIQTTEVTVGQWRVFTGKSGYRTEAEKGGGAYYRSRSKWFQSPARNWDDPGFPQGARHPVTCISWNDAQAFIHWLGREEGPGYRLPTEAEWEYAARAASRTARFWGEATGPACRFANVHDIASKKTSTEIMWRPHDCNDGHAFTAPVASFAANGFGLYDMLGNVWEWCGDWYAPYPTGEEADPTGPPAGTGRIIRGGGWDGAPRNIRSALRDKVWPHRASNDLGFRLVREE